MNPHDDGRLRIALSWRRPDIQIQAVFARRLVAEVVIDVARPQDLNALRCEPVGVIRALPPFHGLRLAPTQIDNGWRSEGNAEVCAYARAKQFSRNGARVYDHRIAFD